MLVPFDGPRPFDPSPRGEHNPPRVDDGSEIVERLVAELLIEFDSLAPVQDQLLAALREYRSAWRSGEPGILEVRHGFDDSNRPIVYLLSGDQNDPVVFHDGHYAGPLSEAPSHYAAERSVGSSGTSELSRALRLCEVAAQRRPDAEVAAEILGHVQDPLEEFAGPFEREFVAAAMQIRQLWLTNEPGCARILTASRSNDRANPSSVVFVEQVVDGRIIIYHSSYTGPLEDAPLRETYERGIFHPLCAAVGRIAVDDLLHRPDPNSQVVEPSECMAVENLVQSAVDIDRLANRLTDAIESTSDHRSRTLLELLERVLPLITKPDIREGFLDLTKDLYCEDIRFPDRMSASDTTLRRRDSQPRALLASKITGHDGDNLLCIARKLFEMAVHVVTNAPDSWADAQHWVFRGVGALRAYQSAILFIGLLANVDGPSRTLPSEAFEPLTEFLRYLNAGPGASRTPTLHVSIDVPPNTPVPVPAAFALLQATTNLVRYADGIGYARLSFDPKTDEFVVYHGSRLTGFVVEVEPNSARYRPMTADEIRAGKSSRTDGGRGTQFMREFATRWSTHSIVAGHATFVSSGGSPGPFLPAEVADGSLSELRFCGLRPERHYASSAVRTPPDAPASRPLRQLAQMVSQATGFVASAPHRPAL
jgi:hypothetical protein